MCVLDLFSTGVSIVEFFFNNKIRCKQNLNRVLINACKKKRYGYGGLINGEKLMDFTLKRTCVRQVFVLGFIEKQIALFFPGIYAIMKKEITPS